jgi:hypothetical protein
VIFFPSWLSARSLSILAVLLSCVIGKDCCAVGVPEKIILGRSYVHLNGPWKFHLGDNPSWADPELDDSKWESVDLTAPPGAHDSDVGLTGYVPGWGARGHAGYTGYAWYRLHIAVDNPDQFALSLAGPPAVDSAYQVFLNGALLGSAGSTFSGPTPSVVSIQPRIFAVPPDLLVTNRSGGDLIAFRVWMGPWDLDDPAAGGIHIAPALGQADAIEMLHQMQWLQTIRGYMAEVVEATVFVLLALIALSLSFRRHGDPYHGIVAALVLTALYRANQAVFFWGQFETIHAFEWISIVFLYPICLAAWTLAWRVVKPGSDAMARSICRSPHFCICVRPVHYFLVVPRHYSQLGRSCLGLGHHHHSLGLRVPHRSHRLSRRPSKGA